MGNVAFNKTEKLMTKKQFREKWEPYFSSFSDNELFALKIIVSEMHRKLPGLPLLAGLLMLG